MNTEAASNSTTMNTAVDFFINSRMYDNPDLLYRARILVLTLFLQIGIIVLLMMGFLFSPLLSESRYFALPIHLGSIGAIAWSLYLLKVNGNYNACCLLPAGNRAGFLCSNRHFCSDGRA